MVSVALALILSKPDTFTIPSGEGQVLVHVSLAVMVRSVYVTGSIKLVIGASPRKRLCLNDIPHSFTLSGRKARHTSIRRIIRD